MNEQQTKQTLPRMRTLAKAIEEIKAEDPNTALTQNQLRVLVKSGAIPSVHAGRHTLINLDFLLGKRLLPERRSGAACARIWQAAPH